MKKPFNKAFVAKSLYGSITLLAVLLSLEDHLPTAWHGASLLLGTALSVALAEAFSESIGQVIAGQKQLDRAELVEIWHETRPVLSAAYLPLLMIVLVGFGLFSVSTAEKKLINEVTQAIQNHEQGPPTGWLAPHISHSKVTPDLLQEAGYEYLLDWATDDQPVWMRTRQGKILSVPYAQEINDIPQIVGRNRTGQQFGDMITDAFATLMEDARKRPVVMSVARHPYLM